MNQMLPIGIVKIQQQKSPARLSFAERPFMGDLARSSIRASSLLNLLQKTRQQNFRAYLLAQQGQARSRLDFFTQPQLSATLIPHDLIKNLVKDEEAAPAFIHVRSARLDGIDRAAALWGEP